MVVLCMIVIWRQPQNMNINTFKAPFVPLLPMFSLFFNIYLMTSLTATSWIRFFVWFAIGIYKHTFYLLDPLKMLKHLKNVLGHF